MNYFYENINNSAREDAVVDEKRYLDDFETLGLYRIRREKLNNPPRVVKALKFECSYPELYLGIRTYGNNFEYSTDGRKWYSVEELPEVSLERRFNFSEENSVIYVRGYNPEVTDTLIKFHSSYYGYEVYPDKGIYCSGNIMHLIDYTQNLVEIPCENCFNATFHECPSLLTAPDLPATILKKGCYDNMFEESYWLQKAPELPAKVLVEDCYRYMFDYCRNLDRVVCMAEEGISDYVDKQFLTYTKNNGVLVVKAGTADLWQNIIPDTWTIEEIE